MNSSPTPPLTCLPLTELDSLFYSWELFGYQAMARIQFEFQDGSIDIGLLRQAYAAEIKRRPVLNARIETLPEAPWQVCWKLRQAVDEQGAVRFQDFSRLSAAEAEEKARQLLYDPLFQYSLRTDPPLFMVLCAMPAGAAKLLAFMHHALADAHGISLVLEELFTSYNELAAGRPIAQPQVCCEPPSPLLPKGRKLWAGIFGALGFLIRRAVRTGFRQPAKIQYGPHRFHAATAAVQRVIRPERLSGLLAAAKRGGFTFNILLTAAQALAIEGWKKSRGEPCAMISMEVHENLRSDERQLQELSNKFSPFIIDVLPEDRKDPATLLRRVQQGQEQARKNGIARKMVCLLALIGTRAGFATQRLWQNFFFNNPRIGDSSLVTNLGRIWTDRDGTARVTRLGDADICTFYMAGPPIPSIGSYFAYLAYRDSLFITFNYYDWVMPAPDASRLMDLFESVLDELAASVMAEKPFASQ